MPRGKTLQTFMGKYEMPWKSSALSQQEPRWKCYCGFWRKKLKWS